MAGNNGQLKRLENDVYEFVASVFGGETFDTKRKAELRKRAVEMGLNELDYQKIVDSARDKYNNSAESEKGGE